MTLSVIDSCKLWVEASAWANIKNSAPPHKPSINRRFTVQLLEFDFIYIDINTSKHFMILPLRNFDRISKKKLEILYKF